ncbi:hypothetical protein BJ741DRAFT_594985 [Chytriomyces cf. hyalinus JEL632]|nr:hypothetical protein BJ741DRAFT_594985 [Chytriomyces cf. hyalinus JEL632]
MDGWRSRAILFSTLFAPRTDGLEPTNPPSNFLHFTTIVQDLITPKNCRMALQLSRAAPGCFFPSESPCQKRDCLKLLQWTKQGEYPGTKMRPNLVNVSATRKRTYDELSLTPFIEPQCKRMDCSGN